MAGLADLVDPESVRKLCRADLTQRQLPNPTIRDPVFVEPAVAELLGLDPDAASRQGDAAATVRSALNRLVAAQVLPTVRFVTKEDFGDGGGFTVQATNVEQRAAELRRQAWNLLAPIAGEQPAGLGPLPAFLVVT